MRRTISKTLMVFVLVMNMMIIPVHAAGNDDYGVTPCFNHTQSIALTINFDRNNTVYCALSALLLSTGTGTSGIMTLFDSTGAILQQWPVSDYDSPIAVEFTYPGTYGERYTLTYTGYVYGNNMTMPDWVELSITDSCVDVY